MTSTMTPVALTINVQEATVASLPAALEARLIGSPTKSPTELAEDLKAAQEKTAALRKAHLDAVRDRAARESQRAAETAARKLRIASNRADKIQRKMDAAKNKTEAKKQASDAERSAKKARREELANAVSEARMMAMRAKALRQAELLEAEKLAYSKHSKTIHEVSTKGAVAVKHALAVVEAHKEKALAEKQSKSEALELKLQLAEVRREQHAASGGLGSSPLRKTENVKDVKFSVLNNVKVECETRRKLFDDSMAKHEAKRAAHLDEVMGKARKASAKAELAVTKAKALKTGTDAATVEARAAMYDRLLRAEVGRLQALKAKYMLAGSKGCKGGCGGDTVSAIVVRMDDVLNVRAPPAELIKRLAVKGSSLLATANARQVGAKSRRAMLFATKQLALAKASERRAAALKTIGKAQAAKAGEAKARFARAIVTRSLAQGKRAHALSQEHGRILAVNAKRVQFEEGLKRVGAIKSEMAKAAAERRAKNLREMAKSGVAAVRNAASKSRRDAAFAAVVSRGEASKARCEAAAAARAAVLGARVELARKRMVAKHPKREVADMEIIPGIEG